MKLIAILFVLFAYSANAQNLGPVSIAVGVPPGGNYDYYSRIVARYIVLPGAPTVIVTNYKSDLLAAESIFSSQNRTIIGAVDSYLLFHMKLNGGMPGMNSNDFYWIGGIARDRRVCFEVENSSDTAFIGISNFNATFAYSKILQTYFSGLVGKPIKNIPGYGGEARRMALQTGELNLDCVGFPNSVVQQWIYTGHARVIIDFSDKQYVEKSLVAFSEIDRETIRMLLNSLQFRVAFQVNSKMPEVNKLIIENAYKNIFNDKKFIEEREKQKDNDVLAAAEYISASEINKSLSDAFFVKNQVILRAREVLK